MACAEVFLAASHPVNSLGRFSLPQSRPTPLPCEWPHPLGCLLSLYLFSYPMNLPLRLPAALARRRCLALAFALFARLSTADPDYRIAELAMGVFGRPCEKAASISSRISPDASLRHSSAGESVIRMPWANRPSSPRKRSCSSTCGRQP